MTRFGEVAGQHDPDAGIILSGCMPGDLIQLIRLNDLTGFFNSIIVAEMRASKRRNMVWPDMIPVNDLNGSRCQFLVDDDFVDLGQRSR